MRTRTRRQSGEGQFGCIVGLILLLIAIVVAYKMIPIKVKAAELRGTVADEAKSAGLHDDAHILAAILMEARKEDLPVEEKDVQIVRKNSEITVDVDYTVPIDFPGFTYRWHLHHHANNPIF